VAIEAEEKMMLIVSLICKTDGERCDLCLFDELDELGQVFTSLATAAIAHHPVIMLDGDKSCT